MLTKGGHGVAAYVLLLLALCHWLDARRLDDDDTTPETAATTETAPD